MVRYTKHIGKTIRERECYTKALKKMEYEPTVDDVLRFFETDDADRDSEIPQNLPRRYPNFKQRIITHFENNWIQWLISAFCIFLFFIMGDYRVKMESISTKVDNIKDDISELKNRTDKNGDQLHKIELKVQENSYKIDNIENKSKK